MKNLNEFAWLLKSLMLVTAACLLSCAVANAQAVKVLKAKQDKDTKLWGYENVGEKFYWWKDAHSLGNDEKLMNGGHETEWVISAQYDNAGKEFSENLVGVEINGRVGFIDVNNRFVIAPQFEPVDKLCGFSKGLAAVKLNGKFGFVDKRGHFVIPPTFDYAENFDDDMLATVKQGKKYGAIDLKGDTVVPCHHIAEAAMKLLPLKNKEYRNAVKVVKAQGNVGYYDEAKKRISAVADSVDAMLRDTCYLSPYRPVLIVGDSAKFGLKHFKTDTAWVLSPHYDEIHKLPHGFCLVEKDRKLGVADAFGRLLIPCTFQEIGYQPEANIFVVSSFRNENTAYVGLYNEQGDMILPCIMNEIYEFHDGYATAELDDMMLTIDRNGQVSDEAISELIANGEDKGTGYFKRIVGLRPTCAQAHNNIGVQYVNLNDLKEGIAYLKIAHKLCPDDKMIAENLSNAKSERNNRRLNKILNILNIAGQVLETTAMAYSAATGTPMATTSGNYSYDATSDATSSFSSAGGGSSNYLTSYRQWEQRAEKNYNSLTNLGWTAKNKKKQDVEGGTSASMNGGNYTRMKRSLREAQNQMRDIRQKAAKAGVNIQQSHWETVTVSYD